MPLYHETENELNQEARALLVRIIKTADMNMFPPDLRKKLNNWYQEHRAHRRLEHKQKEQAQKTIGQIAKAFNQANKELDEVFMQGSKDWIKVDGQCKRRTCTQCGMDITHPHIAEKVIDGVCWGCRYSS